MSAAAPSTSPGFLDKTRNYWRLRFTFFIAAGSGALMTLILAIFWPPTYRTGSTILIEQQEIPQELVRSAISSFADQRVQVISQRVMTTQNLMSLIERYNLYPDIRETKPREILLEKMRSDIALKMISADVIDPRSGRPTQATIAFTVSYQNRSPSLALKVANELTTLYLNENLTSRTQMAEQTTAFFAEEAAKQQARIIELDKQLADFKLKHENSLPELSQLNNQVSDRTELELRDAENQIAALQSQEVLLRAQLAQLNPTSQVFSDTGQRVMGVEDRLKALRSELAGYKARYAPGHPDIVTTEREIAGLEKQAQAQNLKTSDKASDIARQLEEARAQLSRAQQKYSAGHPDVIRLTHLVAELEAELAQQPPAGDAQKLQAHADNPVYIQVKGQLDSIGVEIQSAEAKRNELRAKLDDYERRLAQAPAVERDYRQLSRDLENAQLKYAQVRAKQGDVQVSENLETERKGERFTMIEPPLPPEKPISPNRILIIVAGFLLSLGLGFAAVVARDSFDRSIRGFDDVRQLLTVPPLAAIPSIVTTAEQKHRKVVLRYTWTGVITAVIAGTLLVHFFVLPLDVLWLTLIRRFGV
ncbi:MAG: lipopolysaccharide biosynthesis protein [Steroidobacteraceae bacterium]